MQHPFLTALNLVSIMLEETGSTYCNKPRNVKYNKLVISGFNPIGSIDLVFDMVDKILYVNSLVPASRPHKFATY